MPIAAARTEFTEGLERALARAGWPPHATLGAAIGTESSEPLAHFVEHATEAITGHRPTEACWIRRHQNTSVGLRLATGAGLALKLYRRTPPRLSANLAARAGLARAGFPSPKPLGAWTAPDGTTAVAEELFEGRGTSGKVTRERRQRMAELLFRLVELGDREGLGDGLGPAWFTASTSVLPPSVVPGLPFGQDDPQASWILEAAARARTGEPSTSRRVLGHFDWRVEHMAFDGDAITAVFDWDSLHFERETVLVGAAAHAFSFDRHGPEVPSRADTLAFVSDYEAARGAPFSHEERLEVGRSCLYSAAYSARVSRAFDARGELTGADFRPLLRELIAWGPPKSGQVH